MLKVERVESQMILKSLDAIKPVGLNKIGYGQLCMREGETQF
jgi:hypothetical protein